MHALRAPVYTLSPIGQEGLPASRAETLTKTRLTILDLTFIANTVVMTSDAVITGWTAVCTDALLAHTGPRKEQEEVGLTRDASVNGRARSATGWAKLSI